jgi:hypothetical protein
MNGAALSFMRSTAQVVLAICMRLSMPSCMRAPPELQTATRGSPSAAARSAQRQKRSPTTLPMLPPMNPKSITAITQSLPWIWALPTTRASDKPVLSWADRTLSGYGSRSTNSSGSSDSTDAHSSRNEPSSTSCRSRSRALIRSWRPHDGQTDRLALSCARLAPLPQDLHCHSGLGGSASRRSISTMTFMGRRPRSRYAS